MLALGRDPRAPTAGPHTAPPAQLPRANEAALLLRSSNEEMANEGRRPPALKRGERTRRAARRDASAVPDVGRGVKRGERSGAEQQRLRCSSGSGAHVEGTARRRTAPRAGQGTASPQHPGRRGQHGLCTFLLIKQPMAQNRPQTVRWLLASSSHRHKMAGPARHGVRHGGTAAAPLHPSAARDGWRGHVRTARTCGDRARAELRERRDGKAAPGLRPRGEGSARGGSATAAPPAERERPRSPAASPAGAARSAVPAAQSGGGAERAASPAPPPRHRAGRAALTAARTAAAPHLRAQDGGARVGRRTAGVARR